jgi:hypothetical protein
VRAILVIVIAACSHARGDAPGGVRVVVDGAEVARVGHDQLAARTNLPRVLPDAARDRATWKGFTAHAGSRTLSLDDFAAHYPDSEVTLYLDGDRAAIGVFRRPAADAPAFEQRALAAPRVSLDDVDEIDITTAAAPAASGGPAMTAITLTLDGVAQPLQLGDEDTPLRDVIPGRAESVVVVGADGTRTFARGELDGVTLRHNRRGAITLKIGKGDGAIRDVRSITVTEGGSAPGSR